MRKYWSSICRPCSRLEIDAVSATGDRDVAGFYRRVTALQVLEQTLQSLQIAGVSHQPQLAVVESEANEPLKFRLLTHFANGI